MDSSYRKLRERAISALVAGALVPAGAIAADDLQTLRSDPQALALGIRYRF